MPSSEEEKLQKSSMQILSELFSTFDAAPPVIVKKEKDASKKHKKAKKKHKHKVKKEKKHKKKAKKRKRSDSSSSSSSDSTGFDLAEILIKKELESNPKKIKLEIETEVKQEKVVEPNIVKEENGKVTESVKTEDKDKEKQEKQDAKKKIEFAKLFQSTILEIKQKQEKESSNKNSQNLSESGECTDEEKAETNSKKKVKHRKSDENKTKHKSHQNRSKERKISPIDIRKRTKDKSPHKERSRSRERKYKSKEKDKEKYRDDYKHKERDDFYRHKDREDHKHYNRDEYKHKEGKIREWDEGKYKYYPHKYERELEDYRSRRHKDDGFYKTEEKEDKWFTRDRYRTPREKLAEPGTSSSVWDRIDKKKLLEIARKNAIQMMKSGNLPGALNLGPQAQEKVIAAIKSGGKTIEELTDFCKTLSKKEEMGDLSSVSEDNCSDSDAEMPFHHPFQLKERPSSITMNIKNAIPLPLKSTQERVTELRMQFPVSSGQQHRITESEWVPVSPKKTEVATTTPAPVPKPVPPPPEPEKKEVASSVALVPLPPGPQAFPAQSNALQADIASIVSQRLTAMRKLQENPNDVQAITEMYKAQKEMNTWAVSKQQIGQFTGSTGAQIMSQAELSSGYQAWARKDQLQTAAPVSGGMGMHLLQKMGWKPGEGLGKEKTGALEPLLLEVKLDKKGIVAKEEQKGKGKVAKAQKATVKTVIQGKHPVSLLGEYASKHKQGAPQYSVCFECGPDHKKNFLFKVMLNGIEYKPNVASNTKKEAKAHAATVCLQTLGILPPNAAVPT